jgi:Fe-S cluster biogenesis protein NfuA
MTDKVKCTHPDRLNGRKPGECSPEQHILCHGDAEVVNAKGEAVDKLHDRVTEVLNKVRPSLQADGGDVELVDVTDGIVKVKLTGHCAGCPMSQMTLRNGIERILKQEIPEVKQVVPA